MKNLLPFILSLSMSLCTSAGPANDDAKVVQGNWSPTKVELGGKPMTDDVLKTISLKLDDGKYEVFVGDTPDRGTYTVDSTTNPKSMSIVGMDGPNKGKTYRDL